MKHAFVASVLLTAIPVFADITVTYDTSQAEFAPPSLNQGWWPSSTAGDVNTSTLNDNHYTGRLGNSILRSFYTFDLVGVTGTVTSATFRVHRGFQNATVTLQLWDVSTNAATLNNNVGFNASIFADLGSGNSYGSFVVPTGNSSDYLTFTLDSQALTDISANSGGYFSIGASIAEENTNDIFSNTGSVLGPDVTYLDVTTADNTATPEPRFYGLMFVGMLGLVGSLRSRYCTRRS
jgi:hypothetical protein